MFAFSSPQSGQKQKNREEFRSARAVAEIRRVFAQPRSICDLPNRQCQSRLTPRRPQGVVASFRGPSRPRGLKTKHLIGTCQSLSSFQPGAKRRLRRVASKLKTSKFCFLSRSIREHRACPFDSRGNANVSLPLAMSADPVGRDRPATSRSSQRGERTGKITPAHCALSVSTVTAENPNQFKLLADLLCH